MTINNHLNLIMQRIPLYNQAFPIILFWSQKSGCSSLAKWFFFQINLLDQAQKYHPSIHVYRGRVYNNPENRMRLINALSSDEKPTLKLVRNPYSRAVSSFLHVVHYYDDVLFSNLWTSLNNQNKNQGVSFKQFLYALKKVGSDINSIDGHIAQQYIEGEEQWVQQYIKLEHFNTSIPKLEKKYNLLKSPIESISQSFDHKSLLISTKNYNLENYSEKLMTREILLNGNLPKYNNFYDQETRELCRELFMKDFQTYNYSKLLL